MQEWNLINASIVTSALYSHQVASHMNLNIPEKNLIIANFNIVLL